MGDSGSAYISGSNGNLEISSSNFFLKQDGSINAGAGDFTVDTSGNVSGHDLDLDGTITFTTAGDQAGIIGPVSLSGANGVGIDVGRAGGASTGVGGVVAVRSTVGYEQMIIEGGSTRFGAPTCGQIAMGLNYINSAQGIIRYDWDASPVGGITSGLEIFTYHDASGTPSTHDPTNESQWVRLQTSNSGSVTICEDGMGGTNGYLSIGATYNASIQDTAGYPVHITGNTYHSGNLEMAGDIGFTGAGTKLESYSGTFITTLAVGSSTGRSSSGGVTPYPNVLNVWHSGADGDNGIMIIRDDPTVSSGNILGGIGFDSGDGEVPSSILESSAYIAAYATETHTAADKGGKLTFGASAIDEAEDTVSTEVMVMDATGLDITGTLTVSGAIIGGTRAHYFFGEESNFSADRYLDMAQGHQGNSTDGVTAMRAGSITGISANFAVTAVSTAAASARYSWIELEVRKNGTDVWSSTLLGASDGGTSYTTGAKSKTNTQTRGTDTVAAGDDLAIRINITNFTDSSTSSTTMGDITAYVEITYDT